MTNDVTDNRISFGDKKRKILIYGIGNPGRQDDGLGILLSDRIRSWTESNNIDFVDIDQNYQLNIEDADKISKYETVVFVDASKADIEYCLLEKVIPELKTDFSMHSVTPSFIYALCNQLFPDRPQVFQLHIKGYKWEFMKELSDKAQMNLDIAFETLTDFINNLDN